MITFAVTGGIGSGKSAVCRIIAAEGIPVYDSDSAAKRLYQTDDSLLDAIEEAFGCSIRKADGKFDKAKLTELAFFSKDNLAKLDGIVHPAVLRDFIRWKAMNEANGEKAAAMESAIVMDLPEFMKHLDKIILVDAPLELRLERAAARDNVPKSSIIQRIAAQRFDISKADAIIRNSGTIDDLKKETDSALKILKIK
ncbi:MAG: dephospho-CoA kinase [Bacteroidales bacterium]|nr:dephospho-CoA kinase [Bacteroidales bacterium]